MRRRSVTAGWAAAALLGIPTIATPAPTKKVTVVVSHYGDDAVGQQLAFAVREAVRRSAGYELAAPRDAVLTIQLITIEPELSLAPRGTWTVASIAYTMQNALPFQRGNPQTWYPIFLTAKVVASGRSTVDISAQSILADLDARMEDYRRDAQSQ